MEGSGITFTLSPFFKNFNKRLIKSPKLYFYDTGLALSLLGISSPSQVYSHYLKGGIFENLIIAELTKQSLHRARQLPLYFWRDSNGNEIDGLLHKDNSLDILEIKAGKTLNSDYFKGFAYFQKLIPEMLDRQFLVYGGRESQIRKGTKVYGWQELGKILS